MPTPRKKETNATMTVVDESESKPSTPVLSGYSANVEFLANRYKQGGRTVYSLDLSPLEIASLITPPDPTQTSEGNRAVRPAHADGFGKYIREREDWISPSLMLRSAVPFDFTVREELNGIQFGTLSIPRSKLSDIHIMDGQHRILGIVRAQQGIAVDYDKAQSAKATARRTDKGSAAEREAQQWIDALDKQRRRLANERLNVQIIVVADMIEYKQAFFDISENALGITASIRTRFDSRKIVNRALSQVDSHPLLTNRLDPEGDRMGRGSPYLMGYKHLAEIVRTTTVGLDGRVSRRQEQELKVPDLTASANDFLSILIEALPQMYALSIGQITPDVLRKTSLLGSAVFLRVLAGVYYDLLKIRHWERESVEQYFAKLSPHLTAPVYEGSIWTSHIPANVFTDGAMAPHARRQDATLLKDTLVNWALDKEPFIDAPPAPRPPIEVDWVDPEYGHGYLSVGADIPVSK